MKTQAERSLEVYAEGQKVTDAWHRRLADAPKPTAPKGKVLEDSKRGAVSRLNGKVW